MKNGIRDAVVVLTTIDRSMQQVTYVRSGETYTTTGIPDGIYQLYYKTGARWNGQAFLQPQSAGKFEDPFPINEDSPGWVVTLYSTSDGKASTRDVDEDEFPPIAIE